MYFNKFQRVIIVKSRLNSIHVSKIQFCFNFLLNCYMVEIFFELRLLCILLEFAQLMNFTELLVFIVV